VTITVIAPGMRIAIGGYLDPWPRRQGTGRGHPRRPLLCPDPAAFVRRRRRLPLRGLAAIARLRYSPPGLRRVGIVRLRHREASREQGARLTRTAPRQAGRVDRRRVAIGRGRARPDRKVLCQGNRLVPDECRIPGSAWLKSRENRRKLSARHGSRIQIDRPTA